MVCVTEGCLPCISITFDISLKNFPCLLIIIIIIIMPYICVCLVLTHYYTLHTLTLVLFTLGDMPCTGGGRDLYPPIFPPPVSLPTTLLFRTDRQFWFLLPASLPSPAFSSPALPLPLFSSLPLLCYLLLSLSPAAPPSVPTKHGGAHRPSAHHKNYLHFLHCTLYFPTTHHPTFTFCFCEWYSSIILLFPCSP